MIFDVAVRPEAEPDVYEARDYYAAISVDLAERFEADFQAAATSLAEFPKRHREVYRDVRRVAMQSFPYLVYYRARGRTVSVIALRHAASDPAVTRDRLRQRL
ncbi:MAG: type II toxin-antitoxin system RelE/ParE family toxin [Bifidobacteriaceae bacterium]|jgi:plasmid stabilization system protein ParE|nr:type II toxin-antitoxin system RelE/ParE family toxin [Bifidobacteriaceae bacterium]